MIDLWRTTVVHCLRDIGAESGSLQTERCAHPVESIKKVTVIVDRLGSEYVVGVFGPSLGMRI